MYPPCLDDEFADLPTLDYAPKRKAGSHLATERVVKNDTNPTGLIDGYRRGDVELLRHREISVVHPLGHRSPMPGCNSVAPTQHGRIAIAHLAANVCATCRSGKCTLVPKMGRDLYRRLLEREQAVAELLGDLEFGRPFPRPSGTGGKRSSRR